MKPERLFPLILVIVGAAVFFFAYGKKTQRLAVPPNFVGNRPVELFYQHDCVTCHTVTSLPEARGNHTRIWGKKPREEFCHNDSSNSNFGVPRKEDNQVTSTAISSGLILS